MSRLAKTLLLSVAEQADLMAIIKKGTHKSRKITRARTPLLLAAGKSRVATESELGISSGQYWCTRA